MNSEMTNIVSVVRCVECKHRDTTNCPFSYMEDKWYFLRNVNGNYVSDDWFCANGERR